MRTLGISIARLGPCAMADGVEGLIATMTATLMALPRRSD